MRDKNNNLLNKQLNNSHFNSKLYEALRKLRNGIAQKEAVKPFVILHNKTLEEITINQPKNLKDLLLIKGIGQRRAEKYGEMFLNVIQQFIESREKIFTVSEFIDSINEILLTQRVIIQGEIGEKISRYPAYSIFYLLDKSEDAILKCFIWQEQLNTLGVELRAGLEVKVGGVPEIFKKRGDLTFQIEKIGLIGEGILKQAFEALKKKLTQSGFFDLARKKPVPRFCQKIGLITSQYGKGALPDFLKHLGNYGFKIYFYDVRVEGLSAIDDIVKAIRWFNESMLDIDVLVLIRGGGSWESLQPFNSEIVARTIFSSKIPIICGVGHETDETIADYVADLRASTPTDAARILSDPWRLALTNIFEFERNFNSLVNKILQSSKKMGVFYEKNLDFLIKNIIKNINEKIILFKNNLLTKTKREISSKETRINNLMQSLSYNFQKYFIKFNFLIKEFKNNFLKVEILIKNRQAETNKFLNNLIKNKNWWLEKINKLLAQQKEKLVISSPVLKLKQGYTITLDEFGGIVKDPTRLKIDQIIKTKFSKGRVSSKVKKIEK